MSTASSPDTARRRRGACPLCGKPSSTAQAPFCSQGCRDRDLLNWLGDGYRVPGPPADGAITDFDADGLDSKA